MTIKDETIKKINFNIIWQEVLLSLTVIVVTLVAIFSFYTNTAINTGILGILAILVMASGSILLLDEEKIRLANHKRLPLFLYVVTVTLAIITNTNTIDRMKFINIIKSDHPKLIYTTCGCSKKKKEEILNEYKLIKVNGKYSVKSNNKSYKISNLKVYTYEEF